MKELRHEILDSKISRHDRNRFELKLDVELFPAKKNVYRVETYFFVPRALNINPGTYTKSTFYNSSQKYIRFKTPQISLDKLADPAVEISPLNRIRKNLGSILSGQKDKAVVESAYSEIKLLGCVARGAVRDYVKFLHLEIDSARAAQSGNGAQLETIRENVEGFLKDTRNFISAVRALRLDISNPVVPDKVREALHFFDEFLSLTVVDYLALLLERIREHGGANSASRSIEEEICKTINAQNNYRAEMGYPSLVRKGTSNEVIVYRRSVLKKFISSALFLHIETSQWEGAFQFFFGVAAGLAMLFAVLVMVFAQSRYTTDSLPFIAAAVISYIFKDRLKDWLKIWFTAKWTRWIADRRTSISDPQTGKDIGIFKEAFSFVSAAPADIARRRNIDNITSIDEEGKPERIMKYEKEVVLFADDIFRLYERKKDLNDILRFNVAPFLAQADDPEVDYLYLNPDTCHLELLPCSRVYHVNVVTKYVSYSSGGAEQVSFERIRIVLTRRGIVRLEPVHVD